MIIRTFCLRFSIRLGSLVVGLAYLLEAVIVVIVAAVWLASDPSSTERAFKKLFGDLKLIHVSKVLHKVSMEPSPYRELALVISLLRVGYCGSCIYGTYYMRWKLLTPFVVAEGIRMLFLIFLHITAMQILKENNQDLGLLIVATLSGSAILCFFLYCWLCVYSLMRVLKRLSAHGTVGGSQMFHHGGSSLGFPGRGSGLDKLQQPGKAEFPPRLYPAYYTNYASPIAPVF